MHKKMRGGGMTEVQKVNIIKETRLLMLHHSHSQGTIVCSGTQKGISQKQVLRQRQRQTAKAEADDEGVVG